MAGITAEQREILLGQIHREMPICDRGKREVIERLSRELLDDLQLVHLSELIDEIKREWR